MRKWILALLICLLIPLSARAASIQCDSMPVTANGNSAVCFSDGYIVFSVGVNISGTATVNIACQLQVNGTVWILTDTGLPLTSSKLVGLSTYACKKAWLVVSGCSGCTVTPEWNGWNTK